MSLVQSNYNAANPTTSLNVVLSTNVAVGNLVVVMIRGDASAAISDNLGHTWTAMNSDGFGYRSAFTVVATAGAMTVTVAQSSARLGVSVHHYDSMDSAPLDQDTTVGSGTATSASTASFTTSVANGVAIGMWGGNQTPTPEADYGGANLQGNGTGRLFTCHRLFTSTLTSETIAWTHASAPFQVKGMSFKSAAGSIDLAATPAVSLVSSAALTTAIQAAAAAAISLSSAASLSTQITMSAASAISLSCTANLTVQVSLAATPSIILASSAGLTTAIRMAAAPTISLTSTAAMAGDAALAASPQLSLTSAASLTTAIRMASSSSISLSAGANLSTIIALGSSAVVSLLSAGSLSTSIRLQSAATIALFMSGSLQALNPPTNWIFVRLPATPIVAIRLGAAARIAQRQAVTATLTEIISV